MASVVAGQGSEGDILEQAVALELDCVAAFTSAAERLQADGLRAQMRRFAQEHQARLGRLRQRLDACQLPQTGANRLTEGLNRGKVALSALVGDAAILRAILNNAKDAHQAYAEVAARVELAEPTRAMFAQLAADAGLQLDWFRTQGVGPSA